LGATAPVAESPAPLASRKGEAEPWPMGHARKGWGDVAGAGVNGKPGVAEASKGGRVTGNAGVAEASGGKGAVTNKAGVAEAPGHGGS
jgi:hypothetical protein